MITDPDYDESGRRVRLSGVYPGLPPTSNKLYIFGNKLTGPAREFKENFKSYVQQTYGHQISELEEPNQKAEDGVTDLRTRNPNLVYALTLTFYMDCLNGTWSDASVPKSRRAAFRFKKADLSNRIKLVEDCIKTALDIDDSLTFASTQMKVHDPGNERVQFEIVVADTRAFSIPLVLGGGDM
jgi:hypothetical protein